LKAVLCNFGGWKFLVCNLNQLEEAYTEFLNVKKICAGGFKLPNCCVIFQKTNFAIKAQKAGAELCQVQDKLMLAKPSSPINLTSRTGFTT
jgi:hypothetical protein